MRRHGQLTGGEHPASALLGSHAQGPEGVAIVSRGVGLCQLRLVGVPHRLHPQRAKNSLSKKIHEGRAGDGLHDAACDDVVGVGVLPLRSGLEVQRLLRPGVQNLLRAFGLQRGRHHVILGPVVLVARCVRENLPYSDLVAARQAGNILADGIVQAQLAVFLQHQNRRRCELL